MSTAPLFAGEEIYKLIPQRRPIVMVDAVYQVDETSALTGLSIKEDNIFCKENNLREPGLIEHIAQSAAAFAGYPYFVNGEEPKLGFIGEIKKFRIQRFPLVGESLKTSLKVMGTAAGVTLIAAESKVGDEVIATCNMKIFIKDA